MQAVLEVVGRYVKYSLLIQVSHMEPGVVVKLEYLWNGKKIIIIKKSPKSIPYPAHTTLLPPTFVTTCASGLSITLELLELRIDHCAKWGKEWRRSEGMLGCFIWYEGEKGGGGIRKFRKNNFVGWLTTHEVWTEQKKQQQQQQQKKNKTKKKNQLMKCFCMKLCMKGS